MADDVQIRFGAQIAGLLSGVEQAKASVESLASPVRAIQSSFVGLAEAAGVTFAVDKIIEWTRHTTEAAERATNLAAAIGTTPEKFQEMSAALEIASGSGEGASRTMERLQRNLSTAMADPVSRSARAFTDLSITQKQLSATGGNLDAVMHLLANSFANLADGPNKTAAFIAILGRGFESLIPALKNGAAGYDEFKRKAEEVGGVLSRETTKALTDSAEKMNTLGVAATGLGSNLIAKLKPMIDAVTSSLTSMIAALNRALNMSGPGDRMAALSSQLADVNAQIAKLQGAGTASNAKAIDDAVAAAAGRPTSRGLRPGGLTPGLGPTPEMARSGEMNNLAALQARATAIQSQIDQVEEDMRERARNPGGGELVKPPAGNSAGAKTGGAGKEPAKAPFDAAFSMQLADANAQERIGSLYMTKYSKDQETLLETKAITVAEMVQREMDYSTQLFGLEDARLAKAIEIANSLVATDAAEQAKITADQLRAYEARLQASARYEAQQASLREKAAAAQQKINDAWAAPFKTAFDQLGSTFESAITGLIDRSKTLAQTWADIGKSITAATVSLAGSVLSKVGGGLLGGKPGEGVGDVLGNIASNWIGKQISSMVPNLGTYILD